MWIIPFPKGRKALPYFVILFGFVMLFRCVMSVKSIAQDYGTDKIFVSSEDDYSSFIKGKFFIIEDLEPFMVLAKSSNDAEFHCIADFIDATGNVHYVQYKITNKDERYDEFMKALDGDDVVEFSESGLFIVTENTYDMTYNNYLIDNPLSAERVSRLVEKTTGIGDYESYIKECLNAEIREAIIFGVLTVLLIVAGCLLWIDFKGILSWIFPR